MRLISRIDIKNNFVIKGINYEGLRKIGDPKKLINQYFKAGLDEILLVDCVASLYGRNNLFNLIKQITKDIFIPITLAGGIRSIKDIDIALKSGVDKVAINSHAFLKPNFIKDAVKNFGASTITINIEAKINDKNYYEAYKFYGREKTGIKVLDWIEKVQELGCGEILITSIDHEGLKRGLDFKLLEKVIKQVKVPLIFGGGIGGMKDILYIKNNFQNVSLSIASALHYNLISTEEIKKLKYYSL